MDISLVHTGLAAGAALAALPVILHLFMRQQPKRVVFPALQLIRERQKRSRKKLRVKNWLLLLARMALVALMALALARPRIVTEASLGDQEVPTALGLVFDTSLSMTYKERDKTRLDEAKERALEILSRTPETSQVFIVDTADPAKPTGLSPANARKRIESLVPSPVARPLNTAIGQAYAALAAEDKPRHEVYVLTDLARSAWNFDNPVEGLEQAEKVKNGIKTYVLRLSPKEFQDVAVVDARPAAEIVTEGEPLEVVARLRGEGPAASAVAELWLDGVVRDKKPVEVPSQGEVDVRFTNIKFDPASPLHQGEVRITGHPDPLSFDDIRHFTFAVKPGVRVLVVDDDPDDGSFIAEAIDPDPATLPPGAPRPYRVDRIRSADFLERSTSLSKQYRCVFLNNVSALSDAEWARLGSFAQQGGGLVVGLGRGSDPASYQGSSASQLLPATLDKVIAPKDPTTFGAATDYGHPLFSRYRKEVDAMLATVPVTRYWQVTPREDAKVLLAYADKAPALLERIFKGSQTGHVLLWTTPLSRRPDPTSRDAWNEFPVVGWSFFHLMNQSVAYLSGSTESRPWHEAGSDVVLPIDPTQRARRYAVQSPDKKAPDLLTPAPTADALVITSPRQLGQWTVRGADEAGGPVLGFSIAPPEGESRFVPMEKADLVSRFGDEKNFVLADNTERLEEVVERVRVGRELFPYLMALILLLVTLENLLANRFYREAGSRPAPGTA